MSLNFIYELINIYDIIAYRLYFLILLDVNLIKLSYIFFNVTIRYKRLDKFFIAIRLFRATRPRQKK